MVVQVSGVNLAWMACQDRMAAQVKREMMVYLVALLYLVWMAPEEKMDNLGLMESQESQDAGVMMEVLGYLGVQVNLESKDLMADLGFLVHLVNVVSQLCIGCVWVYGFACLVWVFVLCGCMCLCCVGVYVGCVWVYVCCVGVCGCWMCVGLCVCGCMCL